MKLFKVSHKIEYTINLYKISYWEKGSGRVVNSHGLSEILHIHPQTIRDKVIENKGIVEDRKTTSSSDGFMKRVTPEKLYFYEKKYADKFIEWLEMCAVTNALKGE